MQPPGECLAVPALTPKPYAFATSLVSLICIPGHGTRSRTSGSPKAVAKRT